ncbi:MAG: hypothetical protein CMK36_00895 [Porticoccaceae bacterium]|nr:hypothetical protein [Porticoccaceae bacterium]|tara:strand:- start:266 stop:820 length:555 start_codon:yes stop_codon:yes gene_type:complete
MILEKKLSDQVPDASAFKETSLPPVDSWNTPLSGDLDIDIDREGVWRHEGDLIKRPSLVAFFSSLLRRDGDDYFLITPAEKWRISVAIAPFFIVSAELVDYAEKTAVRMTTRTGETFFVGENNPLWLKKISSEVNPIPLVTVRGDMAGIVSRPVYYDLISWARTTPENTLIIESLGQAYSIGGF